MITERDEQISNIARTFAVDLKSRLGSVQFFEMLDRNKAETAPNVCHSHDFCDANVYMAAAFEEVIGRVPDAGDEADASLLNEAWDLAATVYFEDVAYADAGR